MPTGFNPVYLQGPSPKVSSKYLTEMFVGKHNSEFYHAQKKKYRANKK